MLNGAEVSPSMKFEAAKTLMPYMHAKLGSIGEKEPAEEDDDFGIYATRQPPNIN